MKDSCGTKVEPDPEAVNKEIGPLKEVAEVLEWTPEPAFRDLPLPFRVKRSDKYLSGKEWIESGQRWQWLANNPMRKENPSKPRTLVCHDMMGGYIEDRFCQPTNKDSYSFHHWSGLDIFVYFSHNFLTIPPPGWIKMAKMHGVTVLGTIITEWDEGKARLETILRDSKTMHRFAEKCANIAEYHGFHGYLLNIENPVEEALVPNLIELVGLLTASMKRLGPDCLVIWYDSVTIQGKLEWQDELNSLNKAFFDQCDGIFLNYCWKLPETSDPPKNSLTNSLDALSSHERSNRTADIFVGVDVFGRGCFGGGGFNSAAALKKIREEQLSCAIFAPGWTYELPHRQNRVKEDYLWREHLFWGLLQPYLSFHAIQLTMQGGEDSSTPSASALSGQVDDDGGDAAHHQDHPSHTAAAAGQAATASEEANLVGGGREGGGGGGVGHLVFRSCFCSGRGEEGWFHLAGSHNQPALPTIINNKMCPDPDPSPIHSQNPSLPLLPPTTSSELVASSCPTVSPPSSPPPLPLYCCHTTDTQGFESRQTIFCSISEPGVTIPLFLIIIQPEGRELEFEVVLAPSPAHLHYTGDDESDPSGGHKVDLVLATENGDEIILGEDYTTSSSDGSSSDSRITARSGFGSQMNDDADAPEATNAPPGGQSLSSGSALGGGGCTEKQTCHWRKAGFVLKNCHHTIEKIGLRPKRTSPNFYLGSFSIYLGKS